MLYNTFIDIIDSNDYSKFSEVNELRDEFLDLCARLTKRQIKRVKAGDNSTRNSILFLNILNESKNIALQSVNLMKSQRNMFHTVNGISEEITERNS